MDGTLERSAAVAVVAEDVPLCKLPSLLPGIPRHHLQLLLREVWSLTCLEVETLTYAATLMVLLLAIRPQSTSLLVLEAPVARWPGGPDPNAGSHPGVPSPPDVRATDVSSSPACRVIPAGG
jgi:hypothetical protein